MDKKAMYSLSYGVFMLGTRAGDKKNGCITNTCIQCGTNPARVAISVINTNYSCDLIKESGLFTVSMLDSTVSYETIRYFGMQSGRNVDKLDSLPLPEDENGVPYMGWSACAMLSCKVTGQTDLGSHTLFIGEVLDGKVLSDKAPLTYADYQVNIKPKNTAPLKDKKIIGWRCKICKHVYEGAELPSDYTCPLCGHGAEDFEPVYEA